MKELLGSFHLNGSTLKFRAQNGRFDLGMTVKVKVWRNTRLSSFSIRIICFGYLITCVLKKLRELSLKL